MAAHDARLAPASMNGSAQSRLARALPALALLALLYALVVNAWMCDDAFITFRTVRNLLHGAGATWNPGQRVQAYTHPLWMLCALACHALTQECFFSVLALSGCIALGLALLFAYELRDQPLLAAGAVLLLASSKAFVEFAACGLENPLLFALLGAFVAYSARPDARERLSRLATITACIALTRSDALLLVAPALLDVVGRGRERARALVRLAAGMWPLAGWEIFSLVYYGSLVPNTAIAKLNIDVPAEQLLGHGAAYLLDSLRSDPITLGATLLITQHLVRRRERRADTLVLGLLLYTLFLVCIGGDFMSGRFMGALLVFALAALIEQPFPLRVPKLAQTLSFGALLAYAACWPHNPLHARVDDGIGARLRDVVQPSGIADERAYYYARTGLLPVVLHRQEIVDKHWPLPPFGTAIDGLAFAHGPARAASGMMMGFFGYFAGDKRVIDRCGLTDPFLARIPYRSRTGFRPGHFLRDLPIGYAQSIESGQNHIADPELARLYDRVQLIVSGPLFSAARWRAIACLNFGAC